MQSQGSGVPESRYTMSYSHSALTGDGVDIYGHSTDPYVLHNQHHIIGHGGPPGMSPTGHGIGMGSPGQHHQHSSKRSADVAGLNLKQDPMVGDVTMSTIGMGHSTMDDGGSGAAGGQNGAQAKKTPPPNGKKTKGRVKIKMEFIDNKLRRYTTFSKRKTGIMKKAYELSTLTGTQVMLLVASETGHVYTFATRKLQPMITSEAGKALIQTCLNSPDPPSSTVDQRMSATGFEETELTYTLHDEDQKDSESDDGDEAASSDGASRSPSPADMERSYSPGDRPVEPAQHVMHSTPSRVVNPSRGLSSGGGGGGTRGSAAITAESSQQQQSVSYQLAVNGSRHVHAAATATTAPSTTASSSSATTIAATTTNLASSSNGHLSCPVNLTPSQLASIAANLPGLSGLSLPLPHGTNFASLLASASSLLTGVGAVGGALGGGGLGSAGVASKPPSSSETTRKHLPRLISLAHMGAALQQQPNSAKDAAITSKQQTTNLMADQRNDSSALNLQTGTTSVASRDKKGGGGGVAGGSSNKSRASTKKNKK